MQDTTAKQMTAREIAEYWMKWDYERVVFTETETNLAMSDESGKTLDSHYKPTDHDDMLDKAAYMLYRRFGWGGVRATTDIEIAEKFVIKYLYLDDEYAFEYLQHTEAVTPDISWNYALARPLGYHNYKKLRDAGFAEAFAANTAVQFELLKNNPDRGEIFDILGIQFK